MFYDPARADHGLARDPFKAIVAPRPVGWISSVSAGGQVNLAPYSFFNAVSTRPHVVMFSSEGWKHTIANVKATGEFVCNLATYDLREQMNATSAPAPEATSEFELAGLSPVASRVVTPPRVGESPAALECVVLSVFPIVDRHGATTERWMCLGEVVGVHIDDRLILDGRFDITASRSIARCGYMDYAVVDRVFELDRPTA